MVTLHAALLLLVGVLALSSRQECARPLSVLDDALLPTEEELLAEELKEEGAASTTTVDPLPGHSHLAPAGWRFLRRIEQGFRRIFRIRRCRGEECRRHRSRWRRYNPYIFEKRFKD
ncbi:unnamed protein product [Dibothriocephalus latus]|uniref:Uncharacterized protein n=1 Tax=Dibothriocephalus latus TaxID=60516 RepID=A0A3P7NIN4_DIBLA|nr:unnamed protein product [Dibothriocephalus latus]